MLKILIYSAILKWLKLLMRSYVVRWLFIAIWKGKEEKKRPCDKPILYPQKMELKREKNVNNQQIWPMYLLPCDNPP
jgi:hypothetical protein